MSTLKKGDKVVVHGLDAFPNIKGTIAAKLKVKYSQTYDGLESRDLYITENNSQHETYLVKLDKLAFLRFADASPVWPEEFMVFTAANLRKMH
jgi:hypothetical protein